MMMRQRLAGRLLLACVLVLAVWWYLAPNTLRRLHASVRESRIGAWHGSGAVSPVLPPGAWHGSGAVSPVAEAPSAEPVPATIAIPPPPTAAPVSSDAGQYAVDYAAVPKAVNDASKQDKIIVMAKLQNQSTEWVAEALPKWQNAIYTVDNTSAALHAPLNKGREGNAYLLYLITHYDSLPSTIVFLHHHRAGYPQAWHNDIQSYDNVQLMSQLRTEFIQQNGYANLRCNWNPGCPAEVQLNRQSDGSDEDRRAEQRMADAWHALFGASSPVPDILATPCCAQFAVSREQVLRRPREDYMHYHDWLMKTELSDDVSGRILEYLWHVIFGKDPVYCPRPKQCYQDVYGRPSK